MLIGALARIRAALPAYTDSETAVANWILREPRRLLPLSMGEVADACQVSDTTVLRCAKRAGFQGYTDLKLAIAQEALPESEPLQGEVGSADDAATLIRKVFAASQQALDDTQSLLAPETLDAVVTVLERAVAPSATRSAAGAAVSIAGVGNSAIVAQTLYQRLARVGIRADAPNDIQLQFMHSATLGAGDILFVISRTGVTRDILAIAQQARRNGATVICVTGNARSPLALESSLVLVAASNAYRSEPVASLVAMLTIIDAILVRFGQKHPEQANRIDHTFAHAIVPKSL